MKLTKKDFIAIARYLNMINHDIFTESEVLEYANCYYTDYKAIVNGKITFTDSCLNGLMDELQYFKNDSEVFKVYHILKAYA